MSKLNNLNNICANCILCELHKTRNNVVFGKGNKNAEILFIGEAPGEKEDLGGLPFLGRAGKQLDKFLNKINLSIDDVYIANILKCRPPKNRNPKIEEIKKCTPYLIEQINIINPKIIVTMGNYSSKFLLASLKIENMKNIAGISELHGIAHIIEIGNKQYTIIPIYHPAAMMYNPKIKNDFENDFRNIAKILNHEFKNDEFQKKLL